MDRGVGRDGQAGLLREGRELAGRDVNRDSADQIQTSADIRAQADELRAGVARSGRALDDQVKLVARILRSLVEQSWSDIGRVACAGAATFGPCCQRQCQRDEGESRQRDTAASTSPQSVSALARAGAPERIRADAVLQTACISHAD